MGWQHELRLALENPALAAFESPGIPGPEAAAATYRLALCLGYCRLLGVDLPADVDGTLPASEAMAAAEELIRHLGLWVEEAQQLPSRWDTAPPGVENEYCADLLEARMDAWAAFLAISEAHEDCVIQQERTAQDFGRLLDRLLDALDQFDDTLQQPEILAILSTLTGTPTLDNWRRMLGIPDREFLPWWLDGTLERESQRIEAESLAAMQELQTHRRARVPQLIPSIVRRHTAAAILEVQSDVAQAAQPADEGPPVPTILKWASPDGRLLAWLSCPQPVAVGGRLPLEFLGSEGQPAVDLSGQPVWLADQQETIDAQGRASFDMQSLKTALSGANQPLTLEVGKDRTEWQAIQSE
jgi:hypothetical protein